MLPLYWAATELGGCRWSSTTMYLWGKLRVLNVLKVEKFDSGRTPDLFEVHFCQSAARWQPERAARTQHSVGQTQERPFKKESSSLQARISRMSQSEAFIFAALQAFADVWVQYCLCLPCRLLLSLLTLNHICSFLDIWMLKLKVFRCSFSVLWHVGGQSSEKCVYSFGSVGNPPKWFI